MNSINFKTNSLIKNFKNAIKSIHHCKYDSKTYFMYKSKLKIDKNVDMYIKQIISEIMNKEVVVNNFSKKYITINVISILEEIYNQNGFNLNNNDFKTLYLDLIEDFENEINNTIKNDFKEFEFITHIDNLKLSRKIKIGDVILFPYDSTSNLAYINDNKYISNDFFKDNEVYARTCAYGSKDYVIKKSEVKIKMALNILKFLLPVHYTKFYLDGEMAKNDFREHILLNSDELIGWGSRRIGDFHYYCDIDEGFLKEMSFNLEILYSLNLVETILKFRLTSNLFAWFSKISHIYHYF